MKFSNRILIACALTAVLSCSKGDTVTEFVYSASTPVKVYSFDGDHYSYCPSIAVMDETTHMFFCGNPTSGEFVDNIYHCTVSPGGSVPVAPVSVLQPGLPWDSRHDCDPSVVKGKFKMGGIDYTYALFFLSNRKEYYYNEIGVAFSNDPGAREWVKYDKQIVPKPWSKDGDLYYSETGRCWGVGQPSAISLDKAGKVLLIYTCGDLSGTRVVYRELDISNMSSPVVGEPRNMIVNGLKDLNGAQDYACNCDFALSFENDKIVMVRPVSPYPSSYPDYIPPAQEVDYMNYSDFISGKGEWTRLIRIDRSLSGYPRNHNAGISRDGYGYITLWDTPTVYFTVSKATPDVEASGSRHAEWSYDIYRTEIIRTDK